MTRLGEKPYVHPTAQVTGSTLGRYTEVGAGSHVSRSSLGDYSYCVENTQIAYAEIGKFANIASHVRIYASMHPVERASLHHFTYRSAWYFEGEKDDQGFFDRRAGQGITIGHDTWIGHGAVIMPGVSIGNGAIIGSNAVVTKDVADLPSPWACRREPSSNVSATTSPAGSMQWPGGTGAMTSCIRRCPTSASCGSRRLLRSTSSRAYGINWPPLTSMTWPMM